MCDITNLFKATIKTMKLTDKNITIDKSILKSSKIKSNFESNAHEVVSLITKLKDYLLENRKAYIDSSGFHVLRQSEISDLDRDKIDSETENFMITCHEAISSLSTLVLNLQSSPQIKENKDNILYLLKKYLNDVCKMYRIQKSVRVNRLIERKKLSRLEPDLKLLNKIRDLPKFDHDLTYDQQNTNNKSLSENENKEIEINSFKSEEKSLHIPIDSNPEEITNLSSEEKFLLQIENEKIYNEMSGMVDELKLIVGKIVEISKLQEIFTENVLQQEKDIYSVADTIVGTTENVKGANEELREAMKNKAGILIWILFFLIVNTLSLLFLDWYND